MRSGEIGERPALERQLQVLARVLRQAPSEASLWASAWAGRVRGDLPPAEARVLCQKLAALKGIRAAVVPGTQGSDGVWIPNPGRLAILMDRLGRGAAAASGKPRQVEIIHDPAVAAKALELADDLGAKGLMVVRVATGDVHLVSRVLSRELSHDADKVIEGLLPGRPWLVTDDPSPYSADYSVYLGATP